MNTCEQRLAELSQTFDQRFEADAIAGAKPPKQNGREIVRTDFTFECREANDPPRKEIDLK